MVCQCSSIRAAAQLKFHLRLHWTVLLFFYYFLIMLFAFAAILKPSESVLANWRVLRSKHKRGGVWFGSSRKGVWVKSYKYFMEKDGLHSTGGNSLRKYLYALPQHPLPPRTALFFGRLLAPGHEHWGGEKMNTLTYKIQSFKYLSLTKKKLPISLIFYIFSD